MRKAYIASSHPIPSHQSGIWKTDFPIFPHLLPMEHRSGLSSTVRFCAPDPRFFAVALIHVDHIDRHHPLDSRVVPASPKGVPRLSPHRPKKTLYSGSKMLPERYGFVFLYNWGLTTSLLAWFSFCLMFDPTHVFLAEALAFSLPVPPNPDLLQACEGSHHYIMYNVRKIICHPNEGRTLSSQQLLINTTSDHIPKLALTLEANIWIWELSTLRQLQKQCSIIPMSTGKVLPHRKWYVNVWDWLKDFKGIPTGNQCSSPHIIDIIGFSCRWSRQYHHPSLYIALYAFQWSVKILVVDIFSNHYNSPVVPIKWLIYPDYCWLYCIYISLYINIPLNHHV